jgi:hypothetical protein
MIAFHARTSFMSCLKLIVLIISFHLMGKDIHQDGAISLPTMHELMRMLEEEWNSLISEDQWEIVASIHAAYGQLEVIIRSFFFMDAELLKEGIAACGHMICS